MDPAQKPIRLVLISTGWVRSIHLKNALEPNNIELVGVCERNHKKVKVSLSGAIVPIVKSLQPLTHYEPEGLIISATTLSHGTLVESALELDIPFLCENHYRDSCLCRKLLQKRLSMKCLWCDGIERVRERYSQMLSAVETREIGKVKTFSSEIEKT